MRIASFNVWGRFADWSRRLELLAEWWPSLDVDVLLAQEVCVDEIGDQGTELAEALEYRAWEAVMAPGRGEGVAVFSRSGITDVQAAPLPPSVPPRCMLAATVDGPGGEVRVLTSHLCSGPADANDRQLSRLLAHDQARELVIGADLNVDPERVVPELGRYGLSDDLDGAVRATTPTDGRLFREAWRERLGEYPDLRLDPRRLDYLLSRGLECRGAGSVVVRDGDLLGSDHALVWADYAQR